MKSRKGFTFVEFVIVVAIIGVLASVIFTAMGSMSDGMRSGVITKLSNKGILFKTWEGELMLGSGNSGDRWAFTALNSDVARELREAQKLQKPVTVHYDQKMFVMPWTADTAYFVDRIEETK